MPVLDVPTANRAPIWNPRPADLANNYAEVRTMSSMEADRVFEEFNRDLRLAIQDATDENDPTPSEFSVSCAHIFVKSWLTSAYIRLAEGPDLVCDEPFKVATTVDSLGRIEIVFYKTKQAGRITALISDEGGKIITVFKDGTTRTTQFRR